VLDVINGEVLFAQGDGRLPDAVACGGPVRSGLGMLEEGGALLGVVAELIAEHAEGIDGVGKTAGDFGSGPFLDEEGAQGLVLAMERGFGAEEELGLTRIR
jgi:hypothetical protein